MKSILKYFRIVLGICLAWPIFIIATVASLLHELLELCHLPKAADAVFKPLALIVCWWMMIALGSIVHVEGRENIPQDEAAIFTPNHNSICDVPLFYIGKKGFCAMMAKKETYKVPVVHALLKALDCVPIKRTSAHGVVEAIHAGTEHVQKGNSIVIFPEGTRSKTGRIQTFKSGAFKIAERTGASIVPVAIRNDRYVWEKGAFGIVHVYIKFLPPVVTKNLTEEEAKELPQKVQSLVEEAWNQLPAFETR